jgi:hypothetical protein
MIQTARNFFPTSMPAHLSIAAAIIVVSFLELESSADRLTIARDDDTSG